MLNSPHQRIALFVLSVMMLAPLSLQAVTQAELSNSADDAPLYWTPHGNLSLENACRSTRLWGFWPSFTCSEAHLMIPAGVKVDFPSLQQSTTQATSSHALHQHLMNSQPALVHLASIENSDWTAYELPGYAEQASTWLERQQVQWHARTDAARLNIILSVSLVLALLALASGAYFWLRQPR